MHEPHSPCSQAFLEPGRPSRSRSTYSRLSPGQTSSASRSSPLTVQLTLITPPPCGTRPRPSVSVRRASTARACRRYAAVPRTSSIGVGGPATSSPNRSCDGGSERRRAPSQRQLAGQELLGGRAPAAASGAADPMPVPTRRPTGSQRDRERADRDHHGVAGADLGELLRAGPTGISTAAISSSGSSALRFDAGEEVAPPGRRRAAHRLHLDSGAGGQQRRMRVAGRRRGAEVAADRAAVADLRRADRARGHRQARAAVRRARR